MGASCGAELTSFTTIEMVSLALAEGEPLSVTRIVTLFVLGPCASVGVHVNTPEEAISCFSRNDMDVLALGSFLVTKKESN